MAEEDRTQLKKNYFWNTLGSLMNALSSALLLLVVTRVLGPYYGGVFSLAFAVGQQYQVLGAFEMRPFQATDINEKYPFGVYLGSRIVTCLLMLVALAIYSIYSNGLSENALMLFLVANLKLFDAAEDVFHGMFQQRGRLDIAGRAFFFRALITFVAFALGCIVTGNMVAACALSYCCSAVAFFFLNILPAKAFSSLIPIFSLRQIGRLLLACAPLFIGVFLLNDLVNVPRYGIDANLGKSDQTLYAVLFMPALVINLLAGFIFKPLLTSLAWIWDQQNVRRFFLTIAKGCGAVFVATVVVVILAYPFGLPVLSWLYAIDLSGRMPELMLLLLGGFFNALSVIFYYALVTMRIQKVVAIGYAISDVLARFLCTSLIQGHGLLGAVILYDIAMGSLCLLFLVFAAGGFALKKNSTLQRRAAAEQSNSPEEKCENTTTPR